MPSRALERQPYGFLMLKVSPAGEDHRDAVPIACRNRRFVVLRAAGLNHAGHARRVDVPAAVLWHRHLEMLLREAGVTTDPWLMATSLSAVLEPERILHAVRVHRVAPERLAASWRELVSRVVRGA